jgi:hypothetical protein
MSFRTPFSALRMFPRLMGNQMVILVFFCQRKRCRVIVGNMRSEKYLTWATKNNSLFKNARIAHTHNSSAQPQNTLRTILVTFFCAISLFDTLRTNSATKLLRSYLHNFLCIYLVITICAELAPDLFSFACVLTKQNDNTHYNHLEVQDPNIWI